MSSHRYAEVRGTIEPRMDYSGSKPNRFRRRRTGIALAGSSADFHYRSESDYLRLLEYSRDMDRNDGMMGQLVDRVGDNTIQDGFKVQPKTPDHGINEEFWQRFISWSEDADECDIQGEFTFPEQERLVFRGLLVDGDNFPLPTDGGQLQVLETHRCRTPNRSRRDNLIHGVELDGNRRRVRYYFTRDDIDPSRSVTFGQMESVDARDSEGNKQVFHVYNAKRFTQTRGVTAFAPVFDHCGMLEDIEFARMVQQQIVSCFGFVEERGTDTATLPSTDDPLGKVTNETSSDGSITKVEGVSPGLVYRGKAGRKLNPFSPNVPPATFFDHVKHIITLISINLGMPLVLALLDSSETNFSGWRGAVDQARLGFRRNQRAMIRRFHSPVYKWKVRQWIAAEPALQAAEKRLGKAIFAHSWTAPRWPYIDPMSDTQANILRIAGNQTSPERLANELGDEWDTIIDEKTKNNGYAIRQAKKEAAKINREFDDGQPVQWREIISLPLPQGVTLALAGQPPAQQQQNAPPTDKSKE